MKKLALSLSLLALLGAAPGVIPAAHAQTPAPTVDAANKHAKLEAALKQLNLRPRQKLQILEIVKTAKANGQDPKDTVKQIVGVLDADQKTQLMQLMADAKSQN